MTEPEPLVDALHHEEAERVILGQILIGSVPVSTVAGTLAPEHFGNLKNRAVFSAMVAAYQQNRNPDILGLADELGGNGNAAYLASLTDGLPRVAAVTDWAVIVRERARRRFLANVALRVTQRATDPSVSTEELLSEIQNSLARIARGDEAQLRSLGSVLPEAVASLERFIRSDDGLTGIPTGFRWLDRQTSGLGKGKLYVLAARPGRGKSSLCTQIALNAAMTGARVLVFSCEMAPAEHAERALLTTAALERWDLRADRDAAWKRVSDSVQALRGLKFWYDTREAPTIGQVRARAREFADQDGGVDLIVIDYLQRLSMPVGTDRWLAVGEATRAMKSLARQLDCPLLVACQLNADAHEKRPTMVNLAEARSTISAEADCILFLHPDEPEKFDTVAVPEVRLIVEKQRGGPTGDTVLTFKKHITSFTEEF